MIHILELAFKLKRKNDFVYFSMSVFVQKRWNSILKGIVNIQSRVPFNEIPVHLQKAIKKNEQRCENEFLHLIKFHSINQQSKKMMKHNYSRESDSNDALVYDPTPNFIPDKTIKPRKIYMHDRSMSRANQSEDDFDTMHNDLHGGHENPYEMYPKLALRNLQNLYSMQPRKIPIHHWKIDEMIEKRLGLHIRTPIDYFQFNNNNSNSNKPTTEKNETKNKSSKKKSSKKRKNNTTEVEDSQDEGIKKTRKYVWEIDNDDVSDVPVLNNSSVRDAFGNDLPAFRCGSNQVWYF